MKSLIVPLLATASFATIVVCGMMAASSFAAPYHPHKFKHLTATIWSTTPVKVDTGTQSYERLAALQPEQSLSQDLALRDPVDEAQQQATAGLATSTEVASAPSAAVNVGCEQKYRSYRASDNSYQPLDGGPRRQCEMAPSSVPTAASQPAIAPETVADRSIADHQAWCSARYSSYNSADDSYQPFGGGTRKACMSPVSVASSD